jgi:hypothetical protein
MTHNNLKVHIGELVVGGHDRVDRASLGAALQTELTRLLSLPGSGIATQSRARVDAGTIRPASSSRTLGQRVAQATYNALRGKP